MTIGSSNLELGSPEQVKAPQENLPEIVENPAGELKEAVSVDDVTFAPEEVVEVSGDYKQAEAIEQAFVAAIETPANQNETGFALGAPVNPPLVSKEPEVKVGTVDIEKNIEPAGMDPRLGDVGYQGGFDKSGSLESNIEGREHLIPEAGLGAAASLPGGELGVGSLLEGPGKFGDMGSITDISNNKPGSDDLAMPGQDRTQPLNKQV